MTQRHLQYRDAELDSPGHSGDRGQLDEWVQSRPAPAEGIPDPDPGKPARLGPACIISHSGEHTLAGARSNLDTDSHGFSCFHKLQQSGTMKHFSRCWQGSAPGLEEPATSGWC